MIKVSNITSGTHGFLLVPWKPFSEGEPGFVGKTSLERTKTSTTRWFKPWPFDSPLRGHFSPLKGPRFHHPKKVRKHCQEMTGYQCYKKQCWDMDMDADFPSSKDFMWHRSHDVSWGLSQKKQVIRLVKLWFDGTDDIYIYGCALHVPGPPPHPHGMVPHSTSSNSSSTSTSTTQY